MEKRILSIIKRAVEEFDLHFTLEDSLQDVFDAAQNAIEENVDYDAIDVCERNKHYTHVSWSDDKGHVLEADGEFISTNDEYNRYFREVNGTWTEIDWFEHDDNDYILMAFEIDTDGQKIALVTK